jgi:hypothetical protein
VAIARPSLNNAQACERRTCLRETGGTARLGAAAGTQDLNLIAATRPKATLHIGRRE